MRAAFVLSLALFACGDSEGTPSPEPDAGPETTEPDADAGDPGDPADDGPDAPDAAPDKGPDAPGDAADVPAGPTVNVRYHRGAASYEGWTLEVSAGSSASGAIGFDSVDGFGAVFAVPLAEGADTLSYRFKDAEGNYDPPDAVEVDLGAVNDGIWHFSGGPEPLNPLLRAPPAIPGEGQLVIYYLRPDGAYEGWGLHLWEDVAVPTQWTAAKPADGVDDELGAYFVVDLGAEPEKVGVIVHMGDTKDWPEDRFIQLAELGDMVWLRTGVQDMVPHPVVIPDLEIAGARAHWLEPEVIAWTWTGEAASFELRYDKDGAVRAEGPDVVGGEVIALSEDPAGLSAPLKAKWPHLKSRNALRLDPEDLDLVPGALQGELVVVARDASGAVTDATRVQIPGVIDELFVYDGPLGVTFESDAPRFHVWAPTAQEVRLHHFDSGLSLVETVDMVAEDYGVWSYEGPPAWKGDYYRYEVTVYHPASGKTEVLSVTDPYSVSLSQGSAHSQIVDLDDPALQPEGWSTFDKPGVPPQDITIYESHLRDFSISDASVPAADRGKYRATRHNGEGGAALSNGMAHLSALAEAGLTHFHVLPAFDIATVNEDAAARVELDSGFDALCAKSGEVPSALCQQHGSTPIRDVLAAMDPTTGDAQELVGWMRPHDGFNWGYDPFHYSVPEGSYASEPQGTKRILEFRQMVMDLWAVGLRVALDVVYNHTNSAGLADQSVLDKIVPGYYHRLNVDSGAVETSTCCPNTASEHAMMERLLIDSVMLWARAYKIDAFRFDLMGHHMKSNMLKLRAALDTLNLPQDGVDGPGIYVYGEGWDYGEVGGGARGVNATQANMAGTGIGTFNDRIRDAARGGGPFDSGTNLRKTQGFLNGLFVAPNALNSQTLGEKGKALTAADRVRVGLVGGLKGFKYEDGEGGVSFGGAGGGYTDDPQESVTYVSKHDNQTLFDIIAYKAPTGTSMGDRVRMQNLGVSLTVLGHGVPFLHMGVDLLRSKSMERDSFDSGDWFNRVDFSGATTNWNVGLPRADKDEANWVVIGEILQDEAIAPTAAHTAQSAAHLREVLAIRKSTPLLGLATAEQVETRVVFHNTGPDQQVGLIVMSVTDGTCAGEDLDPALDGVVVAFNATPELRNFAIDGALGYELHPTLKASADPTVKEAGFDGLTFWLGPWTTAVYVLPQGGSQGEGPACNTL